MYNSSEADPLVGTLFDGRFLINSLVARGGMGSIYNANDVKRGHVVALKLLRAEFGDDPVILERFNREAKAVSELHHENICQLYDTGVTQDGTHYFTMEFLSGHPLDSILKKQKVLPPAIAIHYITQVARGLCDAHNHGIIHRDLKPANIFIVHEANGNEFVKLLDFGVAKLEENSQSAKLTNAGSTLGTPHYMSPEQIQGHEVDGRTDVYALGVILWECLFGTPPYTGKTIIEIFHSAMNSKLPKLPQDYRSNQTWKTLYDIMAKALQKDRNDRYKSMQRLLRDLEKVDAQLSADSLSMSSGAMSTSTMPSMPAINVEHKFSPLKFVLIGMAALIFIGAIGVAAYFLVPLGTEITRSVQSTYKFFSDVKAEVRIDGQMVGSTPMSIDTEKKPPFRVNFRTNDDVEHDFQVDKPSTDIIGFAVNLNPTRRDEPMVHVETNPAGADVYLNGSDEKYPLPTPCNISAPPDGDIRIMLKLDGYRSEMITIVPNGDNLNVRTNLFKNN